MFRTYNASYTLNKLLKETTPTDKNATVAAKKAAYDVANKEVAVLCNHQKGVSKAHDAQMEKLQEKKKAMEKEISALRKEKDDKNKKKIATLRERHAKLELQMKVKDELKTVSLGTSKINYLDPRITVAWCKQHEVPPPGRCTRERSSRNSTGRWRWSRRSTFEKKTRERVRSERRASVRRDGDY